jgi:hypothetical protein
MAKPPDRVQLQKQESAAGGGDPADADPLLQTALDSSEDAIDVAGVYVQEDTGGGVSSSDFQVVVYREGNRMWFEDSAHLGVTRVCLTDLVNLKPTEAGQVLFAATVNEFDQRVPILGPQGWLTSGGKLLVK